MRLRYPGGDGDGQMRNPLCGSMEVVMDTNRMHALRSYVLPNSNAKYTNTKLMCSQLACLVRTK